MGDSFGERKFGLIQGGREAKNIEFVNGLFNHYETTRPQLVSILPDLPNEIHDLEAMIHRENRFRVTKVDLGYFLMRKRQYPSICAFAKLLLKEDEEVEYKIFLERLKHISDLMHVKLEEIKKTSE